MFCANKTYLEYVFWIFDIFFQRRAMCPKTWLDIFGYVLLWQHFGSYQNMLKMFAPLSKHFVKHPLFGTDVLRNVLNPFATLHP